MGNSRSKAEKKQTDVRSLLLHKSVIVCSRGSYAIHNSFLDAISSSSIEDVQAPLTDGEYYVFEMFRWCPHLVAATTALVENQFICIPMDMMVCLYDLYADGMDPITQMLTPLRICDDTLFSQHVSSVDPTSVYAVVIPGCGKLTALTFQNLNVFSNVVALNLAYCTGLDDNGMMTICSLKHVRVLNLQGCEKLCQPGFVGFQQVKGLVELNVSDCEWLTDDVLITIAKNCTCLEILFVDGKNKVTTIPVFKKLKMISCSRAANLNKEGTLPKLFQMTSLQVVSLNRMDAVVTDKACALISTSQPLQLRSLSLGSCSQLTNEGLRLLSLGDTLQTIDLSYVVNLGSQGIVTLGNQCPGLIDVNLAYVTSLKDGDIDFLCSKCTTLRKLNLCGTKLGNAVLLSIARECSVMCDINVRECKNMLDEGIIEIAKNCTLLSSLNVSYCELLTNASLEALSCHPNLTSLNVLLCNKLTDDALLSLLCPRLRYLQCTSKVTRHELLTDLKKRNCPRIKID